MRQQRLRRGQRFGRAIARDQERRPLALVDRLHQQVGRDVERLLQQRLGLPHLAGVLIRRRQQIEIVRVMPVELGRDLFARQVVALQLVGGFESRDRLVDAAKPPQLVAVHVHGVRHAGFCAAYAAAWSPLPSCGRCSRTRAPGSDAPATTSAAEGADARSARARNTESTPTTDPWPRSAGSGDSAMPRSSTNSASFGKRRDRAIERLAIRRELRRIARRVFRRHLQRARIDVALDVVARLGRERLRGRRSPAAPARACSARCRRNSSPTCASARFGSASQRLVKRSRRFDPDVVVQIGEALIVEPLRLRRLRPRIVMRRADAGAKRDRTLEQRLRNRGNGMERVLRRKPTANSRVRRKSGKPKRSPWTSRCSRLDSSS